MQKIDLRGLMVPFTLLKISNAFRALAKGEVLEVLWSDSDALDDLVRIIPESSFELILAEDPSKENSGARIQLKKVHGTEKRVRSLPTYK